MSHASASSSATVVGAASPFASVKVFSRLADAMADWAELEAVAPASIYQTRRWLVPWMETIGAARGILPMLVAAHDGAGHPALILLLGIERSGGLHIARFLGGKDANFNMPLVRPGTDFSAADLRQMLEMAARQATPRPDLFVLANQAEGWEGFANCLLNLPHQPSPSFGYKTSLLGNGEAFMAARLSGNARKKLAYKRRKLTQMGPVIVLKPQNPTDIAAILTSYASQKAARFKMLGIKVETAAASDAAFLAQACGMDWETGVPAMEWHALSCNGTIIATFGGGVHRGRLHGMVTTFDLAPEYAAASPGDVLIHAVISDACGRGLNIFDLGIGEARYKSSYCDTAEPLFDCMVPISLKGRLFARAEKLRLAAKRRIKQTPWLWQWMLRLRKARTPVHPA